MGKEPVDIKSIFFGALRRKNAAERAAYLDGACGKDAILRAEVESLLKSHEKAGDFLPSPDLDPDVTLGSSPLTEGPGTVIGNYKLLERIGEGGMAVVYMAEQDKPLQRRVALKLIKLGMDTKEVITRFEVERQALAVMEHPNIAKVLDAGSTETGRPYFVMELVKGIAITDYCDKNKLSTKERLDLFVQVCTAVQHAHQKGIIHRDIKPSNVMVTLRDGKPVPKVIDFGIAKATSQRLTEKTLFTRYAQMIGTPAYMSPEQAEFSELDIDTRTDIYSLGVLLYELLTGTTPFTENELRDAGYLEMQRIIRETDPIKPSTKLRTMGQILEEIADNRRTRPDLLTKLVRGDLDWIVMKSLEKNRIRRYDTAAELAADIQRHFNSEPVQARAPTVSYKLFKFVQRHRFGVIASSLVAAALVIGFIIATYGLVQANWARKESDRQRKHTEELLANGLVFTGDSLVKANHFSQARQSYTDAWEAAKKLGLSEIPATTGFLASYAAGPPPLLGTEWTGKGGGDFTGHTDVVRRVAFLPGDRMAISCSDDGTLRLWDVRTGLQIRTFTGHTGAVRALALSSDGLMAVSCGADRTIRLWDVRTGKEIRRFEGHTHSVGAVAISSDGKMVVSGSDSGELRLWDTTTGQEVRSLREPDGNPILCVAFSPDGRTIVSGGWIWALKVWDVATGRHIGDLYGHVNPARSITFCRYGRWIVTGGDDRTAIIWDAGTGRKVHTFSGHTGPVYSVDICPDDRTVLSGSVDKTLRLWDIGTGDLIRILTGHTSIVESVAISSDGCFALSAGSDCALKLWQLQTGHEITTFSGHSGWVSCVAIAYDGRIALSGGTDGTLRFWDTATGKGIRTFRGHRGTVNDVALSPDGRTAITSSADGLLKHWDLTGGEEIRTFKGHTNDVLCVAFSSDGHTVLSGSSQRNVSGGEGRLKLWNADTGVEIRTFDGHENVRDVVFSQDDRNALSASDDGKMKLWDVSTGRMIREFDCKGPAFCVAVSGDDRTALVGNDAGRLMLWDIVNGKLLHDFAVHSGLVEGVEFMPGSQIAVSCGRDDTVRLWDLESKKEIRTFSEHSHRVQDVAISKDRRWLLSASADGTVKVWDLLCLENNREQETHLREAQKTLAKNPNNPNALSVFGQWYAFRHIDDWAADFLERARRGGAVIPNLTLGRCYWRLGKLTEAHREFQQALKHKEAPDSYLGLCMDALERQQIRPLLQDDTNVQRYRWRAHGEQSIDTTTKDNSKISSTRQMIAWWKFDEAQNEIVLDSSGNGLKGKLVGDACIVSDPVRANVLSLDGDGDYVDCGNSLVFDFTDETTVAFWMKSERQQSFQAAMLSKGDQTWRVAMFHNENHIEFACSGTSGDWFTGNTNVKDGKWHHVTGVYDGSTMYLYVDGTLDESKSSIGEINISYDPIWIGGNSDYGTDRCFNGLIDDVRIYNYALSEEEIKALYEDKEPPRNKESDD